MTPENIPSNTAPQGATPAQNTQVNQSTQTPKKGFPIKTLLLILILFLITGGLIAFSLMPKAKPVEEKKIESPEVLKQTTLTVSSVPRPLATPSAYITDVLINTGQNEISSVQLELLYDPKVLTKVDIKAGTFFDNPVVVLKKIDEENGRISFVIKVSSEEKALLLGQGVLASISFSAIPGSTQAPTSIKFEPKTQVIAEGQSESVLKSSIGALFSIDTIPTLKPPPPATSSAD